MTLAIELIDGIAVSLPRLHDDLVRGPTSSKSSPRLSEHLDLSLSAILFPLLRPIPGVNAM
jgi:hypothetical protein